MINRSNQPFPLFKITKIRKLNPKNSDRIPWSKEHDNYLSELAFKFNLKKWNIVADEMNLRYPNLFATSKKCRERWLNCINPDVSKTALNDYECLALMMYQYVYHNHWATMAKRIPNRTATSLKNNFYSLIRRHLRAILLWNESSPLVGHISAGLDFLQCIFSAIIIAELLRLKSPPSSDNGIAPAYIYYLVKEKGATEEMCLKYAQKAVQEFSEVIIPKKPSLIKLKDIKTHEDLVKLFGSMTNTYIRNLINFNMAIEEMILALLESSFAGQQVRIEEPIPHIPIIPQLVGDKNLSGYYGFEEDNKIDILPISTPGNRFFPLEDLLSPIYEPHTNFTSCCTGGTISKKVSLVNTGFKVKCVCSDIYPDTNDFIPIHDEIDHTVNYGNFQ